MLVRIEPCPSFIAAPGVDLWRRQLFCRGGQSNKSPSRSTTYKITHHTPPSLLRNLSTEKTARARKKFMPQPLTYQVLQQKAFDRAAGGEGAVGAVRGRVSTLNRVLKLLGLEDGAEIGPEMRAGYRATEDAWVSHLTAQDQPARHISNMRSNLGWWRRLVIEIDRENNLRDGVDTPFQQAVKSLFESHPVKRVAKFTEVPHDMIYGWLRGKIPRRSNYPALRRIEAFFALERDHLIRLLAAESTPRYGESSGTNGTTIAYRERLKTVTREAINLSEAGETLLQEWRDLIAHKVSPHTRLVRNLPWRVTSDMPHRTLGWYASTPDNKYVPSASAYWHMFRPYFGYVYREHVGYGKVLPPNAQPSLAWLVLPDLLRRFVDLRLQGAETMHAGISVFLGYVMTLLRPGNGYVWQMSSLQRHLPERSRTWSEQCGEAFAAAEQMVAHYKNKKKPSRNPFEPIQDVIALRNPLDAIVDMLNRMRADKPRTGGLWEAVWARDILLIQILATIPLRAKNLRELTWTPDNRGNLYQQPDGSWHIRIEKNHFKNVAGAAGDRIFDVPVPQSLWKSIQSYLRQFRPLLVGQHACRRVFVTRESVARGKSWSDLNRRVEHLTRRFLWKCPGIGPHAFRHIVATSILRAAPGNFGLAAMVLHDRPATVEASYAFTKSGDASAEIQKLLGATHRQL